MKNIGKKMDSDSNDEKSRSKNKTLKIDSDKDDLSKLKNPRTSGKKLRKAPIRSSSFNR